MEVIAHVNDADVSIKFEVNRPSSCGDMAVTRITIIRHDDLDLDFLALELVRNVTRGTDNLPAMFVLCKFSLSSYGQRRQTDVTHNLDLRPLRSLRVSVMRVTVLQPYTKFSLPVPKIGYG